ncbi:conserved hypothetical protein [Theileria orientalis strain Shintoku]|uniref:Ribosomal protein L1 n=1 Tax=Theileria orientalis strain Shintoku TaxID=869250 RepID=J4DNP1_THEOR|nr:conserved hypothetical protein [Theileria orientalis strain Shintoku]BAM39299.1 conserved hypothetical protein [Theileria orientalis strain Shintoku]|eukprot:XP_009689600.1 conserved hypothetical protein [Theileria orientalis strain Shintoku]
MAVSLLYKLNKGSTTSKSIKKTKKHEKTTKSKLKNKDTGSKHTQGASSLDNKNISLDSTFLEKVVNTFKNREAEDDSRKHDLLEDLSRKYVFLQFKLSKLPPEAHVKPLQITLKHPIYAGKDVCVFVKDPQKTWKEVLFGLKMPEIKKVIGVSKLRKKFKTHEDRKALCNSFDLFLCDKSVVPSLPSLLGSHFIEKKKLPIGVAFTKNKLKEALLRALNATYYKLSQGSCVSVKVATTSMSTQHIVENIEDTLESVKKFHMNDEVFKNHICSVFLNWGGSESLPLYSEDVLEANRINEAAK